MKKIFLLLFLPIQLMAQIPSLQSFKSYPFPTELCSAAKGAKIAFALDEQGKRNVYVAEGPDFKPRKLTLRLPCSSSANAIFAPLAAEHNSVGNG